MVTQEDAQNTQPLSSGATDFLDLLARDFMNKRMRYILVEVHRDSEHAKNPSVVLDTMEQCDAIVDRNYMVKTGREHVVLRAWANSDTIALLKEKLPNLKVFEDIPEPLPL